MKKRLLVSICVFLLLILFLGIGVSYSLWNISVSEDNVNTAMTSCFDITYSSESEAINLEKQYPLSDEIGSKLEPYTFKITNNCDINAYYKINLETLIDSNIDTKFMKASLNNEKPEIISDYETTEVSLKNGKTANTLKSGYLPVSGSVTFDLRVWIDYDTTVDDIKNDGTDKWVGKIVVVSSPVTENEINQACQNSGGDLIDSGECRKYYVKINNVANPINRNYGALIKNEDGSYTASIQNLTYDNTSISILISQNLSNKHSFFYFINILSIGEKLNESGKKLLEFTRCTNINGTTSWPRTDVIYTLENPKIFKGAFITSDSGWNSFFIESYAWAEFTFKDAMLIDLTLMFGEGNEPSKEWCDKYLTEYIAYNLEGTLIPIKDMGEPIKTSYYDVIDLF